MIKKIIQFFKPWKMVAFKDKNKAYSYLRYVERKGCSGYVKNCDENWVVRYKL